MMNHKISIASVSFIAIFFLCSTAFAEDLNGDKEMPSFAISVHLSDRARNFISKEGETIKVIADLFGTAKADIVGIDPNFPRIDLGSFPKELSREGVVEFDSMVVPKKRLSLITSEGVDLLINVVSGRRVSKKNLLECNIFSGPLQEIAGKTIDINCRLIFE